VASIEVGVRRQKGVRLRGGRVSKAIDIMVAVALGMGDADQCAKREVLLDAEPGLTGQVLARHEESFAARAPYGGAGRIDDRLVDSLAGFGGDAAIAERARAAGNGVIGISSASSMMKSRRASPPSGDCLNISRGIGCSMYSSLVAIGVSALVTVETIDERA
jgi:hypothetical protein